MSCLLGIDLGTSSVKAVAFGVEGALKGIGRAEYPILTPRLEGSQVVRPRSAKPPIRGFDSPLPPTRSRKVQELAGAHPLLSFVGALRQHAYGPSPLSSLYEAVLFAVTRFPPSRCHDRR